MKLYLFFLIHIFITGEQQMNAFEYLHQLLKKLTLAVNTLEKTLVNLSIPAKRGGLFLKPIIKNKNLLIILNLL
jgi:hypothetical protein